MDTGAVPGFSKRSGGGGGGGGGGDQLPTSTEGASFLGGGLGHAPPRKF